eukprot:UN28166
MGVRKKVVRSSLFILLWCIMCKIIGYQKKIRTQRFESEGYKNAKAIGKIVEAKRAELLGDKLEKIKSKIMSMDVADLPSEIDVVVSGGGGYSVYAIGVLAVLNMVRKYKQKCKIQRLSGASFGIFLGTFHEKLQLENWSEETLTGQMCIWAYHFIQFNKQHWFPFVFGEQLGVILKCLISKWNKPFPIEKENINVSVTELHYSMFNPFPSIKNKMLDDFNTEAELHES